MTSHQISLKLVPPGNSSKIDVNTCDGCQDLKIETPIFFGLLAEAFGFTDETEEQEFLLKYHLNGHSVFPRSTAPKQLVSRNKSNSILGLND